MLLAAAARIISTYVENTIWKLQESLQCKDHLHIRGEYSKIKYTERSGLGSSPHTWRILYCYSHQERKYRIISTYVENTLKDIGKQQIIQDHLHIRGEYGLSKIQFNHNLGSSPHTWRIQNAMTVHIDGLRIISTYVENTSCFCV